jgi:exopolysaccharide biosynthesis predicted pyruvyltransferase EpsI
MGFSARRRRRAAGHGAATLIAREQRSATLARAAFDADVGLLPDMAVALRELE